jgi:ribosomal protein S18 acetylase RimI-like enzyme
VTVATVRPATLEDVEFLSQLMWLGHQADHPGAPDQAPEAWIDRARAENHAQLRGCPKNSTTSVIEADTERVGRLRVVRSPDRHVLAGIQILPDHRGSGIGTQIITLLLHEARSMSVPVELTVSKHNPNAERLYTRLGFRRAGQHGNDYLMTTR